MNKYLEVKNKLENQGWHVYLGQAGKSYFSKSVAAGLVIVVDQCTGEHDASIWCPQYFADKHMPQL
jgi:hypothetical protein